MPYATSRGAKSLKGEVSKLFTEGEVLEIQALLGLSRSKQEIIAELRRKYPKFLRVDEQKLRDGINGVGVSIYNEKKNEIKRKEASVENLEEREKKYFQKIFDNSEVIEDIKQRWVQFVSDDPERYKKLTAKDIKELSVVQAIGTRDLRDYKVRRAGKLTNLTAEELQQAKVELVQQLTMRKGGETLEIKYTKESQGNAVSKVAEVFEEVDTRVVQQAEADIVREQEA
jgi:hypothetical protein